MMAKILGPDHTTCAEIQGDVCPLVNEADMFQRNLWYGHQTDYPDDCDAQTGERVLSDVLKDVSHGAKVRINENNTKKNRFFFDC
jgi:hypothetical protein